LAGSRKPPRVVTRAWEQALRPRAARGQAARASARARSRRSMIKLHFADDVRQEVARRLIPDVYRQAPRRDPHRAGGGARPAGGDPRGERGPEVRRGRRGQAGPSRSGPTRGSPIEHAPKPFAGEARVDQALTALQEQARGSNRAVEARGRPGRPRDRRLHPDPRGGRKPRSEDRLRLRDRRRRRAARDGGGGDRTRRGRARARPGCASRTTTATRRCAASRPRPRWRSPR